MRRLLIILLLVACKDSASTVSKPTPTASSAAPSASVTASASASVTASATATASVTASASAAIARPAACKATFGEMEQTAGCNVDVECAYPEGECVCGGCRGGGHYDPNTADRGSTWICNRKPCVGMKQGAPCATGARCMICDTRWSCPNGRWTRFVMPTRP